MRQETAPVDSWSAGRLGRALDAVSLFDAAVRLALELMPLMRLLYRTSAAGLLSFADGDPIAIAGRRGAAV